MTTGPRFTLQPTLRTSIALGGSYSFVDCSSMSPLYVNIDNHRYGGDFTLNYALSNNASAYLTGSSQHVHFADQVNNTDFRQDGGLAGIKYAVARTVLGLAFGYTRLHQSEPTAVAGITGTGQSAGNLGPGGATQRAEISRLISPRQRVSLHAMKRVTDAADLFRLGIDQAVPTTVPNRILTSQPATDREFRASWRFQENRTAFELDALSMSQRYATPASNLDVKIASALLARQLSPVVNWDIGATYQHATYLVAAPQDTVTALTIESSKST